MPFVHLKMACADLSEQRRGRLQSGLTGLMHRVLHKQRSLTVVAVELSAAQQWSVGGEALPADAWAAELDAYVSAGTNTAAERAEFVAAADALLRAAWERPPQAPLYVIVHEVPTDSWGYDGRTQLSRRP